ncbi:alpha/beta hydrolase family protein [Propioniciclava flava]
MKKNTRLALYLCSALALLVSCLGASLVQTGAGSTQVQELTIASPSGRTMSALLLRPSGATPATPAPTIALSHGTWNNKEMQDANYVELARRGYVVLSIDQYSHGNSQNLTRAEFPDMWALGINDAVEYAATLPFVDISRIGVSGHSNGALSANLAVVHDNQRPQPLISSVVLVANDAFYTDDTGAWTNIYGHRDVAIIADRYDEFFFNGGNLGKPATPACSGLPQQSEARRFLSFGLEPPAGFVAAGGVVSSQALDGTTAHRVISMIDGEHALATINPAAISALIDSFLRRLSSSAAQPAGKRPDLGGEAGLQCAGLGRSWGPHHTARGNTHAVQRPRTSGGAPDEAHGTPPGALVGVLQVVGVAFSAFSYLWIGGNTTVMGLALQLGPSGVAIGPVFVIGLWAAANGIFLLVVNAWSWLIPPGVCPGPAGWSLCGSVPGPCRAGRPGNCRGGLPHRGDGAVLLHR